MSLSAPPSSDRTEINSFEGATAFKVATGTPRAAGTNEKSPKITRFNSATQKWETVQLESQHWMAQRDADSGGAKKAPKSPTRFNKSTRKWETDEEKQETDVETGGGGGGGAAYISSKESKTSSRSPARRQPPAQRPAAAVPPKPPPAVVDLALT